MNHKLNAFNSSFLKEAVSLNIVQLKDLRSGWLAKLGLASVRPGRTLADTEADLNLLGQTFMEESIHLYTPGRSQGFIAIDGFARGIVKLKGGGLESFLQQHIVR